MKRVHLTISGRVQGVFYRSNTQDKALSLGLKGFVRNIENNSVEVVAEGDENKILELIKFCKNNPGYSKVEDIKIEYEEFKDEFDSFEVRY